MQLAEFNLGILRYPIDDPRVRRFVMALDTVNAIAECAPGFVWRQTVVPVDSDGRTIPNLSTWADVASLEAFVWNTVHKTFHDRREIWFEALETQTFVMWWVEDDHRPSLEEARARLDHLNEFGDSDHAFGWSYAAGKALARSA